MELGLSASQPVDGESFHPEFLGALTPGVRAHFYNSGTGSSNPKKPVGTLVATTVPSVTTTVTGASVTHGLDVKVEGTGFNPTTNPGDAGVYVALAPADTVIDYGNRASMAAMTAVNYVMPSDFAGDSFTTVLNAPTEKLVPGKEYAVFTWQAHTHSNTTQDTKTPVAIDWSVFAPAPAPTPAPVPTPAPALQVKPKVKAKVAKAPSTKKAGKAVVTLTGKAGTVTGKVNATLKVAGQEEGRQGHREAEQEGQDDHQAAQGQARRLQARRPVHRRRQLHQGPQGREVPHRPLTAYVTRIPAQPGFPVVGTRCSTCQPAESPAVRGFREPTKKAQGRESAGRQNSSPANGPPTYAASAGSSGRGPISSAYAAASSCGS